ncbi:MAG TPA: ATP-binding protein [Clostridia bacterium]|nr:ATP-binding protein [Clostridia bacterium]
MDSSITPLRVQWLRVTLACDFSRVRAVAQATRQLLAAEGCGEDETMDCELALVEACNNAIKYVAPGSVGQSILVEVLCGPREIELRIYDHTPGFDWPDKAVLPDPESESGRGLYLIRSTMNYAKYFRGKDENVLVLRKHRSRPATLS